MDQMQYEGGSDKDMNEENQTSEVQCTFRTSLPEQFQLAEELEIQLQTTSGVKELSSIVKQMIEDEGQLDEAEAQEIKTRKLQFMVNDTFITTNLQETIEKLSLSAETVIQIWYSFALDKPKPKMSIPQDEWISVIKSLSFSKKPQQYVAAFFNGDVKILNGKDKKHAEMIFAQKLHQDQINDCIYYKSEALGGKDILVSCSLQPYPELQISSISQNKLKVISHVQEELSDNLNGWNCLAQNPLSHDTFASSSINFQRPQEGGNKQSDLASVQLWKLTEESLQNQSANVQGSLKRQKIETSTLEPTQFIQINGGVKSLQWIDSDTLVAGCQDHAIKLIDIEKSYLIKQSIMTDHKVPTCMDTGAESLILTGCEDSVIRLYDTRANGMQRPQMKSEYHGHTRYINQIKFNSFVENVFLSASIDGTVRLWDLRNTDVPLANLKNKNVENVVDYKVFALDWNGASQILSGGSDSHISVHSM